MDGYYLQTHRITCVNRISGVKIKSEAKTDKCEWKTEKQECSVYPASKQLLNPSHFFRFHFFLLSSLLVLPVCSPFPLFILSISLKHPFNFDGMAFQYLCTNYSLSLSCLIWLLGLPFCFSSSSILPPRLRNRYDMFFIYFSRCIHISFTWLYASVVKNLNPQILARQSLGSISCHPMPFCHRIWMVWSLPSKKREKTKQ